MNVEQKILDVLYRNRYRKDNPLLSIADLRQETLCESADVRIRELRRALEKRFGSSEVFANRATTYLKAQNLLYSLEKFDRTILLNCNGSKGMVDFKSPIARFRVMKNGKYVWVYLLLLNAEEIKQVYPKFKPLF